MIVVSDASPLIALGAAGEIWLLHEMYGEVLVPEQVFTEATADDRPGALAIRAADWIRTVRVRDTGLVEILGELVDRGEAEAIALALEMKADALLMDERRARTLAERHGLPVTGVLAILLAAKSRRLLDEVGPVLGRMISTVAFRISPALHEATLRKAGE